jgi:hypothetical protein
MCVCVRGWVLFGSIFHTLFCVAYVFVSIDRLVFGLAGCYVSSCCAHCCVVLFGVSDAASTSLQCRFAVCRQRCLADVVAKLLCFFLNLLHVMLHISSLIAPPSTCNSWFHFLCRFPRFSFVIRTSAEGKIVYLCLAVAASVLAFAVASAACLVCRHECRPPCRLPLCV